MLSYLLSSLRLSTLSVMLSIGTIIVFLFPSLHLVKSFSPSRFGLRLNISSSLKMSKPEIQVVHQPDDAFLKQKGVYDWPIWGCEESRFPWTYYETESSYIIQGEVIVTPTDGRAAVSIQKGDFVTFPEGLSCVWEVKEAVQKHYMFH